MNVYGLVHKINSFTADYEINFKLSNSEKALIVGEVEHIA